MCQLGVVVPPIISALMVNVHHSPLTPGSITFPHVLDPEQIAESMLTMISIIWELSWGGGLQAWRRMGNGKSIQAKAYIYERPTFVGAWFGFGNARVSIELETFAGGQ
jgi:hypothetical protein